MISVCNKHNNSWTVPDSLMKLHRWAQIIIMCVSVFEILKDLVYWNKTVWVWTEVSVPENSFVFQRDSVFWEFGFQRLDCIWHDTCDNLVCALQLSSNNRKSCNFNGEKLYDAVLDSSYAQSLVVAVKFKYQTMNREVRIPHRKWRIITQKWPRVGAVLITDVSHDQWRSQW